MANVQDVHRWLHAHPRVYDACTVVVTAVAAVPFSYGLSQRSYGLLALLPFAYCVPLGFRTRHLRGAFYATAALGVIGLLLQFPTLSGAIAAMVMVYSVTAHAPGRHASATLWLAAAGGILAGLRWHHYAAGMFPNPHSGQNADIVRIADTAAMSLICTAPLVICWLWGRMVHARQEYLQEALDRVERLERERQALARVAVVEERTRIAREMHDVIAHSLSVIVLQADGAALLIDRNPQRASLALAAIGKTSRQALAEMRGLLGVLHESDPSARSAAGFRPQPGLPDIADLVEEIRAAGLAVSLEQPPDPASVPAGLGLSAYRIVQEALTNTLKHGGPGTVVQIRLEARNDCLVIEVADDGRGASAIDDGAGHGLTGMRERAAAAGGQVSARPRPGGGFLVSARLPYDPSSPAPTAVVASDPVVAPGLAETQSPRELD